MPRRRSCRPDVARLCTVNFHKEQARRLTCADTTMLGSLIHDASAQYIAAVMFALTVLTVGALRSAWRRRNRSQCDEDPLASASERGLSAVVPNQQPETSSEGRRMESS